MASFLELDWPTNTTGMDTLGGAEAQVADHGGDSTSVVATNYSHDTSCTVLYDLSMFFDLPAEVQHRIIVWLGKLGGLRAIAVVSLASRELHAIAQANSLWRSLAKRFLKLNSEQTQPWIGILDWKLCCKQQLLLCKPGSYALLN